MHVKISIRSRVNTLKGLLVTTNMNAKTQNIVANQLAVWLYEVPLTSPPIGGTRYTRRPLN